MSADRRLDFWIVTAAFNVFVSGGLIAIIWACTA